MGECRSHRRLPRWNFSLLHALTRRPVDKSRLRTRAAAPSLLLSLSVGMLAPPLFGQSALDGFDPNVNGTVYATAVQADGKIIIGGNFTSVGGTHHTNVARLNIDGSIDATFNAGADDQVLALAVQSDGKILAGGGFSRLSGQ